MANDIFIGRENSNYSLEWGSTSIVKLT